jgi:hypothetical protein
MLNRFLKKYPLFLPVSATTTLGLLYGHSVLSQRQSSYHAYQQISEKLKQRPTPTSFLSLMPKHTEISELHASPQPFKSLEHTVLMNANFINAPHIHHAPDSKIELNALSAECWPEFLAGLQGDIYITFGHRKAFAKDNPIKFTHAVIYIYDKQGTHALFGYAKGKATQIINDANNHAVSRHYTLYPGLTVRGTHQQVNTILETIETHSKQTYDGIHCNCFSPIISGLLDAENQGLQVPAYFNESLLVVIPNEQNYGMGITTNRYLQPLSASASARVLGLFKSLQQQAAQKFDQVRHYKKIER